MQTRNTRRNTCASHGSSRDRHRGRRPARAHGLQQRHARAATDPSDGGDDGRATRSGRSPPTSSSRAAPPSTRSWSADGVVIGVKEDQPGLGYLDADHRRAHRLRRRHRPLDRRIARLRRGQDRVQGDPVGEPRAGDRQRRHRLLRRHLLDHRQAQGADRLRRPVLHHRPGPARRRRQRRHQRARRPRRQDRVLGDRLDADPEHPRRVQPRRHRRSSTRTRSASRSCKTARSTPSRPTRRSSSATRRRSPTTSRSSASRSARSATASASPKGDTALQRVHQHAVHRRWRRLDRDLRRAPRARPASRATQPAVDPTSDPSGGGAVGAAPHRHSPHETRGGPHGRHHRQPRPLGRGARSAR